MPNMMKLSRTDKVLQILSALRGGRDRPRVPKTIAQLAAELGLVRANRKRTQIPCWRLFDRGVRVCMDLYDAPRPHSSQSLWMATRSSWQRCSARSVSR